MRILNHSQGDRGPTIVYVPHETVREVPAPPPQPAPATDLRPILDSIESLSSRGLLFVTIGLLAVLDVITLWRH